MVSYNPSTRIISTYFEQNLNFASNSDRLMYFVYDFFIEIIRTNTAAFKPSYESLKQVQKLDHGKLCSPSLSF
jgi:hypothetical protein